MAVLIGVIPSTALLPAGLFPGGAGDDEGGGRRHGAAVPGVQPEAGGGIFGVVFGAGSGCNAGVCSRLAWNILSYHRVLTPDEVEMVVVVQSSCLCFSFSSSLFSLCAQPLIASSARAGQNIPQACGRVSW